MGSCFLCAYSPFFYGFFVTRQIKFLNQTLTEIRINLREKRGKLDQVNQELDSLKSTYNAKLKGLDAIMKKDNVMINYINRDAEIILKASIFDQVLYEAVKICREIPEADAMAEDTFIDDHSFILPINHLQGNTHNKYHLWYQQNPIRMARPTPYTASNEA